MEGDRKPIPVVRTDVDERDAQFSPDGKWIAYQSNESGHYEIYVQPFLRPGNRLQVSDTGGAQVRWRRDGRELFYIALDDRMMAVAVNLAPPGGQAIDVGRPEALFATRVGGAVQARNRQQYDVSEDGQRFLMNVTSQESVSTITVILNWRPRF